MNRLRIVVEETGPDSWAAVYCGSDRAKAEQALHAPTDKNRALFIKPSVSQYNRPGVTPAPVQAKPIIAPISHKRSKQ